MDLDRFSRLPWQTAPVPKVGPASYRCPHLTNMGTADMFGGEEKSAYKSLSIRVGSVRVGRDSLCRAATLLLLVTFLLQPTSSGSDEVSQASPPDT